MSKTMAMVDISTVTNLVVCLDSVRQSDCLIAVNGCSVTIGDTYAGGRFYHAGELILTPLEIAQKEIERLNAEKAQLEAAYREGVNSI